MNAQRMRQAPYPASCPGASCSGINVARKSRIRITQVIQTRATNVLPGDQLSGRLSQIVPTRYSKTVPHVLMPTVAMEMSKCAAMKYGIRRLFSSSNNDPAAHLSLSGLHIAVAVRLRRSRRWCRQAQRCMCEKHTLETLPEAKSFGDAREQEASEEADGIQLVVQCTVTFCTRP